MTMGSSRKKVAGCTHGLAEVDGFSFGAGTLGTLLQSLVFIFPSNWPNG